MASAQPAAPGAIRELYTALWQQARGGRGTLVGALSLLSAAQLVRLALPWLAGQAINTLQAGDFAGSGRWIATLGVVYLAAWLLHAPGRVLERNVAVRVRETLADQLYARIAGAPLAWHDAHHSGELQHRVHQASRALADFAQNQFVYLQNLINFAGPLVALALLSRSAGLIALAGYLLVAVVVLKFDRALMRLARAENDADRRYVAALLDFVGNASTVIGLRLQAASRALLRLRVLAISQPLKRTAVLNEGKWFAVDMMGLLLTWGLVVLHVWQSREPGQGVMLGTVFMIYQYAQQAAGVVGSMAANFQSFARMHTDYGSAAPLWQAPEEAPQTHAPVQAGAAWRQLRIEHLQWAWGDAGRGAGLQVPRLQLQRGQRVALVGPSGGGKSTLLRLLAGLYLPGGGRLYIDDAVHEWLALRSLATLIPQEAEVFEASVRENLGFGEEKDEAALAAALHASAFDEVVANLPAGLDSPLTERGFNLSGGQRQRLALARGVLSAAGSSLLLLDEPTSALDSATELRVLQRIGEAFPDACIVASIHRLSVLPHFDTVLLMQAGRVADAGPRDEVLARQPQLQQAGQR